MTEEKYTMVNLSAKLDEKNKAHYDLDDDETTHYAIAYKGADHLHPSHVDKLVGLGYVVSERPLPGAYDPAESVVVEIPMEQWVELERLKRAR